MNWKPSDGYVEQAAQDERDAFEKLIPRIGGMTHWHIFQAGAEHARAAQATTPAPAEPSKPFPGRIFGGATLDDRLRAREAQEIAGKFDTRAALEQARKDRAATPAPEPDAEQLRLAGLTLIGLAEHDQHCEVFDLDDEGKHQACTCGFDGAIAVITQAGKMAATPAPAPSADREVALSAGMQMGNSLGVSSLHAIRIIAAYELGLVPSGAATPAPAPLTNEQIEAAVRGAGLNFTQPDFTVARTVERARAFARARAVERACAEAWGVKLAGQGKEASK